ncbi:MAG: ankyrin repeat domain-containing protein [Pseudomonadota bacterium]
MATRTGSLIDAVRFEDGALVDELIESGAALEEVDIKGQTPLIIAAKTDQFEIAERLLEAGADPFAVSQFGWTAGYATATSRLQRGPEFEAKARVTAMLEERGYPMPGPDKPDIKRSVAEGKWPPRNFEQ